MGMIDVQAESLSQVPIPWVKHESRNAANPCMSQLIDLEGFEGYGRYWRLIELLSDSTTHMVPPVGERGSKRYQIGLRFASAETFGAFLETLLSLDLIESAGDGWYAVPLVEETAHSIGRSRANGSKGGRKAAENRKRARV